MGSIWLLQQPHKIRHLLMDNLDSLTHKVYREISIKSNFSPMLSPMYFERCLFIETENKNAGLQAGRAAERQQGLLDEEATWTLHMTLIQTSSFIL